MTLDNVAVTTPCHNAGKDMLGKMRLFTMLMEGVNNVRTSMHLEECDWEAIIPGYRRSECYSDRVGTCVMLGHIHDERPESATVNIGDVAELLQRQPEKFSAPDGEGPAFLVITMDGGHGAREGLTCYALGLLWWTANLDLLATGENIGGWSKEQNTENANGCAARRMNGEAIMLDSEEPSKLLSPQQVKDATTAGCTVPADLNRSVKMHECLAELVRRVDGAACEIGGGNIDCFVARDDIELENLVENYGLDFDAEEIKAFYTAAPHDQESFAEFCPTCTEERAAIYNVVLQCMQAEGDQQCMRRTDHSCTWRKNPAHPNCADRPRRMPASFWNLLDMFGGWPPMPVPSQQRPPNTNSNDISEWVGGSYMSLSERIAMADQCCANGDNVPDKYDPEAIFKEIDHTSGLVENVLRGRAVTPHGMRILVDKLRNHPDDVNVAIATAVARRKYDKVVVALKESNRESGIERAVCDFVAAQCEGMSRVAELKQVLQQRFNVPRSQVQKCRALLVKRLHELAGLGEADAGMANAPIITPISTLPSSSDEELSSESEAEVELQAPAAAAEAAVEAASVPAPALATCSGSGGELEAFIVDHDVAAIDSRAINVLVEQAILPQEEMNDTSVDKWDYLPRVDPTPHPDGASSRGRKRQRPRRLLGQ